MKKILLTVLLVAAAAFAANAQDIITKVDGTCISAKVLEVNPEAVKYNLVDNPDGPVYVLFIQDIHTIRYENGFVETYNDLPDEAPEEFEPQRPPVTPVRYRDIAGYYDHHDYVAKDGDPYIPALSGVASFFLPGLGQCLDGEWGRGLGIVAANVGFGMLEVAEACALFYAAEVSTQAYKNTYIFDSYYDPYSRLGRANGIFGAAFSACLLTMAAQTAFNIWGICDAVKIAKVKNMYYHDSLAGSYASLDMNLSPQIAFIPTAGGTLQPTAGLSLKVSF